MQKPERTFIAVVAALALILVFMVVHRTPTKVSSPVIHHVKTVEEIKEYNQKTLRDIWCSDHYCE